MISVLTPTITGREWFRYRCSNSVKAQTYDGVIEHLIRQSDGVPPTVAFQACLEMAHGEFVMPVADDDWIGPHACEVLVDGLITQNADVSMAQSVISNGKGGRVTALGGAIMWRKTLTDSIGGFDSRWVHACDTDLYSRMVEAGAKFVYFPEPLYFQTEHAQHNAYLHADELAVELRELHELHAQAIEELERLVA